jgi:ABC-type uncharacterized transport system substrate-binding protein
MENNNIAQSSKLPDDLTSTQSSTSTSTQDKKSPIKTVLFYLIALVIAGLLIAGWFSKDQIFNSFGKQTATAPITDNTATDKYQGKKIVFIDSYQLGLPWSDAIFEGINSVLDKTKVDLIVYRMDTKNNPSEEFAIQQAEKVKNLLDTTKPDVVIMCDDAAFKYVIQRYYKDASLPIIFCGINWDLERYNGPYTNTAGMIEVALSDKGVNELLPFAKGKRVGYLTEDTISETANARFLAKNTGLLSDNTVYVKNFEQWKKAYVDLQNKTDVMVIGVNGSYLNWSDPVQKKALVDFVMENTKIPTVTEHAWMVEFTLLAYGKRGQEQGQWSANSALRVLDGETPREIGVVYNQEGDLAINLRLADILGIKFRTDLLKKAKIFE